MENNLTPLMKQFWEIKSLHADKILLFRMGDFFEMFYDDAVKAAPILGITLTQRNKKSEDQTPMCGVPHHSISGPINKLLAAGLKIAICDQIEDPKFAKGLVKRAVTRVLTPGMIYDSDTLDGTRSHFMASLDENTVSFIETTTGECFYFDTLVYSKHRAHFASQIQLLKLMNVAEVVVNSNVLVQENLDKLKTEFALVSLYDNAEALPHLPNLPTSAYLLQNYVLSLADQKLKTVLQPFYKKETEERMLLSSQTLRHLEIFQNYKGGVEGSLFQAIQKTKTSAGTRLLRQWILFPLQNVKAILNRQSKITFFRDDLYQLKKIRETLSMVGDIERRINKIALPQCHARDLLSLAQSTTAALQLVELSQKVVSLSNSIDLNLIFNLTQKIEKTISEEAPLTLKQGHLIKKGVHSELDDLIDLSTNAQLHIENLENKEKEATGISSLKIRYNNVFGYYIEITHLHKDKVPKHYQRKQTLANAERFCTDELLELEKKVLSAQTKRFELEHTLFEELRAEVLKEASHFLKLAAYCSEVDVLSSLAWLSLEESYCAPEFNTEQKLLITQSRHPVVEQFQRGKFIANTIDLNPEECYLITGPNMAGKSTLMRQVALTALLAQIGSYVPASQAQLPVYDSIYTRIGASDQLSEGLSTFMVEMTETASMLKQASSRSLLILDEVGRGTATYDGLSLAQAILEYILSTIKSHVLFATHYHELTALEKTNSQVKNVHMKIYENKGVIQFLHVLSSGPAGQSYGVKVAELAGLPQAITTRAQALLQAHELGSKTAHLSEPSSSEHKVSKKLKSTDQLSFFQQVPEPVVIETIKEVVKYQVDPDKEMLIKELSNFSILNTSPLQALNQIAEWQKKLN